MEHGVVVDTDVVIDFFSGKEPSAGKVADLVARGVLELTSVTVFELYAGILGRKRLEQIDGIVSLARVLPLDTDSGVAAVGIYNDLKKAGQLIGVQDILIAGICLAAKRPLLTRNTEHFSRIPNLELIYGHP